MRTEGFNQLVVDWKSAIEAGDHEKCTKTSSALCQYFYATSKVFGEGNETVNQKARDVFMLIHSAPQSSFARQLTRISAQTIVNPAVNGAFSLIKLETVLETAFPKSCPPQALSAADQEEKALILAQTLNDIFESRRLVFDYPMETFAENAWRRKEFIMEIEAQLFIPPNYLTKELSFEHLPFVSPSSILEDSLSLTKTKEFIMEVLAGRHSDIYDDATVYLAVSRLFLNRFYETYPEMIAPREVDLRLVASGDVPEEYTAEPLMIEMDYEKPLKIISLWLTFKALEEGAPRIDRFIDKLVKFNCLSKDSIAEAGKAQLKTWIRGMEVIFLKAIDYDVSVEGFDQAGRNQLPEITQAIAEISLEVADELPPSAGMDWGVRQIGKGVGEMNL